jgi:hypothetical protein
MLQTAVDKRRFGPWALITGASSGIGREFARQIAVSGINLVLVARREALLKEVGASCAGDFGVEYRVLVADLSEDGFITKLAADTQDLDIGLVISNAGAPIPGTFLKGDRDAMVTGLRLNTASHLDIAYYFGQKLAKRRRGGLVLLGAMGSEKGIPFMANDAGAKAYVRSLARALHAELKLQGVHVTLLAPGPTETPALDLFGFTPETMPMKPMKLEQCVREALAALAANRPMIIPGRINRIMNALVPDAIVRNMMAKMFAKSLAGARAASHRQSASGEDGNPKMQDTR